MSEINYRVNGRSISLKEYTSALAEIVSEVASTKGVSEETARTCLLTAINMLKADDDGVNVVALLHA